MKVKQIVFLTTIIFSIHSFTGNSFGFDLGGALNSIAKELEKGANELEQGLQQGQKQQSPTNQNSAGFTPNDQNCASWEMMSDFEMQQACFHFVEKKKIAEERRKKEQRQRRLAEQRRQEEQRQRQLAEQRRKEEEQRQLDEIKRERAQRQLAEQRRKEEEQRRQEEIRRYEEFHANRKPYELMTDEEQQSAIEKATIHFEGSAPNYTKEETLLAIEKATGISGIPMHIAEEVTESCDERFVIVGAVVGTINNKQ